MSSGPVSRAACCALAALLGGVVAPADSVRTLTRSVTEVAPGVHVIIHPDASSDWPQGNTTVVVGQRAVLVVDACLLPSSAAEDIADIRRLTDKPVRYLLNTHWHIDHNGGNGVYVREFPGVDIIAHAETDRVMRIVNPGVASGWASDEGSLASEVGRLRAALDGDASEAGLIRTPDTERDLMRRIADREAQIAEYRQFQFAPPTTRFETSLSIDLGGRTVELRYFGRGNTTGDAVAWLPNERIVATGDLLVAPVPYMSGSFPASWRRALREIAALNPAIIVPGHGAVQHDQRHLQNVTALLDEVVLKATEAARTTRNAADVQIDLSRFRDQMAGDDEVNRLWWSQMVEGAVVERAFQEARGKL